MDAVLVFPSMPAVMKLNKLGTFSMEQLGQSKNALADFMRSSMKKARETNDNYEEGLLKLVRTLPNVSAPPSPPHYCDVLPASAFQLTAHSMA